MKPTTYSNGPGSRLALFLVWAAVLTMVGCDNHVEYSPTAPQWGVGEPRLLMISGNNQIGTVGSPLGAPFEVRVVDQNGTPILGAAVLWDIVEGGGDFPGIPKGLNKIYHETKSDADGYVSVVLTLGSEPGPNVVEAKLLFDAASLEFVATGKAKR